MYPGFYSWEQFYSLQRDAGGYLEQQNLIDSTAPATRAALALAKQLLACHPKALLSRDAVTSLDRGQLSAFDGLGISRPDCPSPVPINDGCSDGGGGGGAGGGSDGGGGGGGDGGDGGSDSSGGGGGGGDSSGGGGGGNGGGGGGGGGGSGGGGGGGGGGGSNGGGGTGSGTDGGTDGGTGGGTDGSTGGGTGGGGTSEGSEGKVNLQKRPPNEPLRQPPVIRSSAGRVSFTLEVGAHRHEDSFLNFTTRAFLYEGKAFGTVGPTYLLTHTAIYPLSASG